MSDNSGRYLLTDPQSVRGRQVRAARAILDWSIVVAAKNCGVGTTTISRLELGDHPTSSRTMQDIVRAFETHGVLFIDSPQGAGVLVVDTQ